MSQYLVIAFLILALALFAWAVFSEIRIRNLQDQLALSEQEKKNADIEAKDRALTDAESAALLLKELGGSKPPA